MKTFSCVDRFWGLLTFKCSYPLLAQIFFFAGEVAVLFTFKGSLNILIINLLSVSDMVLFTYLSINFVHNSFTKQNS